MSDDKPESPVVVGERVLTEPNDFGALAPLAAHANIASPDDTLAARATVLQNLDKLGALALAAQRIQVRRDGSVIVVPAPDLKTAHAVQRTGAELLGLMPDKDELDKRARAVGTPIEEVAKVLNRAGYEVIRRIDGKPNGSGSAAN